MEKEMKRKLILSIALGLVGSFFVAGLAFAEQATKVDVCHREGNGSYHLINISENALPAHLNHGDGRPGGPVPGMEGKKFDEKCNIVEVVPPVVEQGYSNLTGEAGVRYKGDSSGNEIYLGFGDLGIGENRVEAAYPDVISNWPDGTYLLTFSYDGENTITTDMVDEAGTVTSLIFTDAAPVCGAWNVMDVLVLDRLSTAAIAFEDVTIDGFDLGSFGTFDVPGAPGWSVANWTMTDFDFSQGFTITGDLVVEGWTGNERNKLQLTVGCLP
jgi:hypothetical protein